MTSLTAALLTLRWIREVPTRSVVKELGKGGVGGWAQKAGLRLHLDYFHVPTVHTGTYVFGAVSLIQRLEACGKDMSI